MTEERVVSEGLLNDEDLTFLASAMEKKYAMYLGRRTFSIRNWEADEGVYVEVTLQNSDQSFIYPVSARIKYRHEELSLHEAAMFLIDYIDTYFEEFWQEDEDLFIPIDWTDFEYEGNKFQLKGQIFNNKADALADALLASNEPYNGPNIIF